MPDPNTSQQDVPQGDPVGNMQNQQGADLPGDNQDNAVNTQGQTAPTVPNTNDNKAVPSISDMAKPVSPPAGTDPAGGASENTPNLSQDVAGQEDPTVPPQQVVPSQAMPPGPQGSGVQGPPVQPTNIGGSIPPGGAQTVSPDLTNSSVGSTQMNKQTQPVPEGSMPQPVQSGAANANEELKKTHEPVIDLPDRLEMGQVVNVKVKVGMIPHVMEDEHHIQSIELYANDQLVAKKDLQVGEGVVPEAEFQAALVAGLVLKAVAYCNIHGKWESTRTVGGDTM